MSTGEHRIVISRHKERTFQLLKDHINGDPIFSKVTDWASVDEMLEQLCRLSSIAHIFTSNLFRRLPCMVCSIG